MHPHLLRPDSHASIPIPAGPAGPAGLPVQIQAGERVPPGTPPAHRSPPRAAHSSGTAASARSAARGGRWAEDGVIQAGQQLPAWQPLSSSVAACVPESLAVLCHLLHACSRLPVGQARKVYQPQRRVMQQALGRRHEGALPCRLLGGVLQAQRDVKQLRRGWAGAGRQSWAPHIVLVWHRQQRRRQPARSCCRQLCMRGGRCRCISQVSEADHHVASRASPARPGPARGRLSRPAAPPRLPLQQTGEQLGMQPGFWPCCMCPQVGRTKNRCPQHCNAAPQRRHSHHPPELHSSTAGSPTTSLMNARSWRLQV